MTVWDRISRTIERFRKRRMQRFAALFRVTEATRILDVGGTAMNWMLLDVRPRVTLLNMPGERKSTSDAAFEWVYADGRRLPFRDQSFHIVFSNSVIEHVGTREDHGRFADEIRRVGISYCVQTPNRWFPVELHLMTPFLHFLPRSLQRRVIERWTLWDWLEHPSRDRRDYYIRHYLRDIRLLGATELAALFPDGKLLRERFFGLTKALVMIKR